MTSNSPLPIEAFPAWARLNDVDFINAKLQNIKGKGLGLVVIKDTSESMKSTESAGRTVDDTLADQLENVTIEQGDKKDDQEKSKDDSNGKDKDRTERDTKGIAQGGQAGEKPTKLLRIPHDLVLSVTAVEDYAKIDQNFRQLLQVTGHESARKDILLYLLIHLILSTRASSVPRGNASTPWTEYTKFLPRYIPVPTMWSEVERALLQGTSLEVALGAKLAALESEFDTFREKSSGLPFWNSLFWENDTATIRDWILVDAWYRSRCLELPRAGDSMVPGLDMANHSHLPTAYYEENNQDDVELLLRPGIGAIEGQEITISYGAKSPAEMLFSYGFIDQESATQELVLPLEPMSDDPLGMAKLRIFKGPPTLKLSRSEGELKWHSPFAYLMCLNEEDGIDFRVLQDQNGNRELRLFWQDEDVTSRADEFESLIGDHPLSQVFRLRVVAVLQELVSTQLTELQAGPHPAQLESLCEAGLVSAECIQAAELLKELEAKIIENAVDLLDEQKAHLIADPHVVAYLGSMENTESGQVSATRTNEDDEDDFS